jgi:cytochrome c oxidase subunit IV
MHVDAESVRKSVRTYMMIGAALLVFTGITVAANLLHLPVPAAITLALIIAAIKASMVAAVFMHLNHEKQWIYGSLVLTVAFFIVLMSVPLFTTMDTFGKHLTGPAAGHGATAGAPADEHAGH